MTKSLLLPLLLGVLTASVQLHAKDSAICPVTKFQQADKTWAGHYYLQGVMEVGSELLLKPDGTFKWYLAAGALDQYAEGTWWKNSFCIGLAAAPDYRQSLKIFPARLDLAEEGLKVIWPDGGQKGLYRLAPHPHDNPER